MADEGVSAGSVYVTVEPRVGSDWSAKVLGETRGSASKVGDDLGDRIGKAISTRIARSIRDGIETGGVGLPAQGTKAGNDYGDKFSSEVKRRINAALRDLPTPTIGVATTEAEQKLKDLRSELSTLSSQRIGVDLSGAEALAEVRRIRDELDRLRTASADVQVRANTAAAIAELAAVDEEVRRLNGQTASVNVNTNAANASRDINLLVSAGLAIGPAIVPGAVAAAAAILTIGSAATSALAGVGVGALAFHGVSDAVKALDADQQAAAKSGATLAGQQKTLGAGADQVRSAEASLANTRAQAADSAVRAEEQVTSAQQAATRAQRDLNDAILTEQQARQELSQNIKGNTLAQEQAALDVAKAKAAYEAQSSEQNRISYEEAKLRAEDLGIQGKRLAAQAATDAKTSVADSQRVIDAKAKVAQAEQAVGDSERQREAQARQSAFAIQQASQAVVNAQRSVGAATVAAAATGGAAVDKLAASMGNLPVSGQIFARFIFGLKGDLLELQGVAADGILPGAQDGIRTLLPYFGDLRTFVGGVATEIGDLERRAAATFTDPFWRQFFGFIAGQAVPNLELMYQAGINVAESGARIVQAFSPVEREVGGGLLTLTQRFLAFSQGLDHNQGFQNFVAYAEREGPHVIATIEALAQAGLHVAAGYAPVGSIVVSELHLLAQVINALPVSVITGLVQAITAYKTATLVAAPAQSLLNSGLVSGIGKMVTYKTVTSAAGITTTGFQRATSAASSFIGGPFLVALSLAALAVGYFAEKQAEAKAKTDEAKTSLENFGQTFADGVTPAAQQSATQLLANDSALKGLVDTANRHNISTTELVAGLNGEADARQKVTDALNDHIGALYLEAAVEKDPAKAKALKEEAQGQERLRDAYIAKSKAAEAAGASTKAAIDQQKELSGNLSVLSITFDNANASATDYGNAIKAIDNITDSAAAKASALGLVADKVATSNLNAADKAKVFGQVLADLGASAGVSGPVFDGLAESFSAIAQSAIDANDKSKLLKQTLDQMYGAAISQTEATEAQVRTQDALTVQLGKNSAGFDLNKAKTVDNRAAILANRDALEAALQSARDKYVQDIANGVAEDKARAEHDKTVKSILDGIPTTQRNTQAVKDLNAEYGAIPPIKTTVVSTPGLGAAIDQLVNAHAVQYGLDQHPVWTNDQIDAYAGYLRTKMSGAPSQALFHADGGAVFGPGGPTDDMVPAMLSNDEHVITAAEVKAAGGHENIYKLRGAILSGGLKGVLPGFATGGAVSSKIPIEILSSPQPPTPLAVLLNLLEAARAAQAGGTGSADLGIAKTIADVALSLHADRKVLLSAMETALVESGMHNLRYGDRDSLGVFQQRPSQGWGTPAEILNVAHAARSYLQRAIANEPRYAKATAGQLAQSVQRSAFPARYDQRQAQANAIIDALSGAATSGIGISAGGSAAIKRFILSTDPLPYVFGAAGPNAYDCSGIASAVVGLMSGRGGGHGQRYFVTQDFANGAPAGFKPGPGGTLTIGVNPAEHMAGNYGGLGFEARGTKAGILVGSAARRTSTFQKQFHLAGGGAVSAELLEKLGLDIGGDPSGLTVNGRKLYDGGGYLRPGLTLADNRTGGLEKVLSPAETAAWQRLSAGLGDGGVPHVEVHNYLDGREIAAHTEVVIDRKLDRVASLVGSGVRD